MTPETGKTSVLQPTLRQRTKSAMRAEVIDVAFRLFAQHGFANTTVEQIAAEAGLSRTTFFRYFGTKEEVVLGSISALGIDVADALRRRPTDEPIWQAVRRSLDVVTTVEGSDSISGRKQMRLLGDACALRTLEWEKKYGWRAALTPEVERRLRFDSPDGRINHADLQIDISLYSSAIVAAALGCVDAATDAWTATDGRRSFSELLDVAMSWVNPSLG